MQEHRVFIIGYLQLTHGAHDTREDGVCLLEAVAWLAGEPHTDAPACASPVLAAYGRALNDKLLPARADLEPRLRALAPRLVGTAGRPDLDQLAGLMSADWLIRVHVPAWLRLAGLTDQADALGSGDLIRSWDGLPITELQAAHSAAWSAAWRAARSAAVTENALAPTERELQDSAIELYERMIALWEVADDAR